MLQRTDDWYQIRLGKATASRFNDVIATIGRGEAAARRNYRAQLVAERLTGYREDTFTSKEMQWGIENEPLARLRYVLTTHNMVEECGFFEHPTLACGASPDGLIGEDGLIEIKCPLTATHIKTLRTREVPEQYIAQVQGQLWITGRKWADFVSFDPRLPVNASTVIVRMSRSESYINALNEKLQGFLAEVETEAEYITNYRSNQ